MRACMVNAYGSEQSGHWRRTPVLLVGNLTIDIVDKKKALVNHSQLATYCKRAMTPLQIVVQCREVQYHMQQLLQQLLVSGPALSQQLAQMQILLCLRAMSCTSSPPRRLSPSSTHTRGGVRSSLYAVHHPKHNAFVITGMLCNFCTTHTLSALYKRQLPMIPDDALLDTFMQ